MCAFDVSCLTQHQVLVSATIWLGAIIKVSNYLLFAHAQRRHRSVPALWLVSCVVLRCFGNISLVINVF